MMGITSRQRDALAFIGAYIEQHGCSPSLGDIAAAMQYRSKSAAHRVVAELKQRGYLTASRLPRSIALRSGQPAPSYVLPPQVQSMLAGYCAASGECAADVVADAVALHLGGLTSAEEAS